jgi:hypothetical protein
MKLQEYFNQQRNHGLSDIQKIDVYHTIMDKNMKKSFNRKKSFLHIKAFVYSSFLLFFLIGFYGMYFFQQDIEENDWYILSRLSPSNLAQADFVAKIVDFDGNFHIEQAGNIVRSSNIKDGDIITLRESAQMVFHINDDTKAKITGPAKFVINKKSEWSYKINLLYGEYAEISSLTQENKNNIEFTTDGISVAQWEKKPLHFQFVRNWENHVIKNNWAKLVVTADGKKATNVDNNQVLAVQGNDVSVFDSLEKFAKAVTDKKLSQTFTFVDELPTESIISPEWEETEVARYKVLDSEALLSISEATIEEKELENVDIGLTSTDQVISPDQLKVLDRQLDVASLQTELNQLISAYELGDLSSFTRYFASLEKRFSAAWLAFWYTYSSPKGNEQERIQWLVDVARNLSDHITKSYLLPPKYLEGLKVVISNLGSLKDIPFGKN